MQIVNGYFVFFTFAHYYDAYITRILKKNICSMPSYTWLIYYMTF